MSRAWDTWARMKRMLLYQVSCKKQKQKQNIVQVLHPWKINQKLHILKDPQIAKISNSKQMKPKRLKVPYYLNFFLSTYIDSLSS